MKFTALISFLVLNNSTSLANKCDHSADVLILQDLQDTMRRALREADDHVEDIVEELEELFRRPRFGLMTFKETQSVGCVDFPLTFTRNDDRLENVYERLRADTPASIKDHGSAFSALYAALTWKEVQWESINRILVLFTNNLPIPANHTASATTASIRGCQRIVATPDPDEIVSKLKETRTTVLFILPGASSSVSTYWRDFNSLLGQSSSLVTVRTNDLDDWIEHKKHFFRVLQSENCAAVSGSGKASALRGNLSK